MSQDVRGRGAFREGTISIFSLVPKLPPRNFSARIGVLPSPCASSLVEVARYWCAFVGSPSARHVCSSCSLGSEILVVVEDIFELDSSRKKTAFVDSWGC